MFKNIKIYVLLLITTGFIACSTDNEVDPLFDQPVNDRVNAEIASFKKTLVDAENGWKVEYQPEANTGAYSIYLKFDNDNNVEIVSDYENGDNDLPTTYRVGIAQSIELVFESFSTFHHLFEARQFAVGAEFEMEFVESTDDVITLKSKTDLQTDEKEKSTIKLVRATAEDKDRIAALQGLDARIKTGFINPSLFRNLVVKNGADETLFSGQFNYDDLPRLSTVTTFENGEESITEYPIISTALGFDFINPITISGTEFKSFTYDDGNDWFISTVGDLTATISYSNMPAFVKDDLKVLKTTGYNRFALRVTWGTSPRTSSGFDDIINQVNDNLSGIDESFHWFEVHLDNTNTTGTGAPTTVDVWINMRGNNNNDSFWANYKFGAIVIDNILHLNYIGTGNGNGNFYEARVQPLLDFFGSSNGLYYEDFGLYNSSTAVNWPNRSGTMTSLETPSQRVYGLWYTTP